jgi:hypothetical protein
MSYPTVNPFSFGTSYHVPDAVTRLPFDMMRTSMVTRDPGKMAMAVSAYRAQQEAQDFTGAMLLPQRMMFQQHKRLDAGTVRGGMRQALSSAATLSASTVPTTVTGRTLQTMRVPAGTPTYAMAVAARANGGNAFPRPEFAPLPPGVTVAATPRVRPMTQPVLPPYDAYGRAAEQMEQSVSLSKSQDSRGAMLAIAGIRESYRRLIGF